MKVNFTDVQTGFEPIPSGHYLCYVTDGELGTAGEGAKHPGSEYINWTLTVAQGPLEGRKVFTNTTLLPHALFGLKGLLAATGKWSKEELDSGEFEFEIEDVIGTQVIAIVTVGTYQGEPTNNVKRFRQVSEEALTALGESSDSMLPS